MAEAHYRRALHLCPEGSRLEAGLLVAHGEALLERGELAQARSVLERGLLALHEAGDATAEAEATDRLAYTLWVLGDATAVEVAARAAALLEGEPPSAQQAKVMADWAAMCAAAYESETAIVVADRVLELCRELRLPVSLRALGWRGLARCHFGDAGGLDDLRRALGLAKRQGLGRYGGMLYSNLAQEVLTFRGPKAAWRLRREGVEFAGGRGDQMSMIGLQSEEAGDFYWAGRWDAALALAGKIEEPLAAADQVLDLVCVRSTVARILTARGQAAEPDVRAFVEWARGRQFADPANALDVLDALAGAHGSLGERDQALRLLTRIAEVRESISSCPQFGLMLPSELRAAAELGDLGLAQRLAAKTVASRPLDSYALVLLSALEAEHEGRLEQAAGHYAEVAPLWRSFGAPYEEAQALLGQGRCLVSIGRAEEASKPLRRAARVFKRLGADPALAQTTRLLGPRGRVRTRGARG